MITVRDIEKATMTETKRREAHNNIFAFYVGRPISYILTIPFLYTKITPNEITFFSMFLLLIGYAFFQCSNNIFCFVIGWFFFFLWNIFDGIDGNVARYRKQFSINGDLWDTTAGYMAMVVTYMAAGVCASKTSNFEAINSEVYIILGAWASIFSIFPRLVLHKKAASQGNGASVSELRDKGSFSLIKILVLNIISITGFLQVLWLCAILFNRCDLFIVFYFIANFGTMVLSLNKLLKGDEPK